MFPEAEGKQNSLFSIGSVTECFAIPPNSKMEETAKKLFALPQLALGQFRGFKVHDLSTRESKVQVVVSLGI